MSHAKVIKHDPEFNSKNKLMIKHNQSNEEDAPPVSEKKILTATKSELRSALKFKERMTNSREASTEKHQLLESRTPIKSAIKLKPFVTTTKKGAVVEEKEEVLSEKKLNGNTENDAIDQPVNSASGSKQESSTNTETQKDQEVNDFNCETEEK